MKAITLAALLGGCASVATDAGYDHVAQLVADRTGETTAWDHGAPDDAAIAQRVAELLKGDLTQHNAVAIALINNKSLQASYHELGIAQADLLAAGQLSNPSLTVAVGFPENSNAVISTEFGLVQSLLDVALLPMRKHVAAQQFEHEQLRLAGEIVAMVAKVKKEFIALQAAQQIAELRRMVLSAAQSASELAERQYVAGNIGDLELESQRDAFAQCKLDVAHAELQLELQRESLTRLLGLWGAQTNWHVSATLAELPSAEDDLEHLETLAITQRLDIASAKQQVDVVAQALHITKTSRFVGAVDVGVQRETGPERGIAVTGPTLRVELPIFNQRQAPIRKLTAQLAQSQDHLDALSIDARSEVRAARITLLSARAVVEQYRNVVLPIRERTVAFAQQRYNAMLLGVFQLLLVKRSEIDGYRGYIEAVRDYWLARIELSRVVGGQLVTKETK